MDILRSEIERFCPPRKVQVPESKILLIGPVGAGKSSFFNTIASVFRGRVTSQAPSGSAEHSITSQVCLFPLSCLTRIYTAFANSVDPDQLASSEAN